MRRDPKGRLELTWMGKDSALIPVEEGKYDYAWVDPTDPRALEIKTIETVERVGDLSGPTGACENLLVIGDSGDALRSLSTIPEYAAKYRGQVKLVYIDPPFNTRQVFGDHYADQLEHSIWLTMMRDRIRAMRPLLSAAASIWVHLDDAESHRMRSLLDEEFGAENFIATIVWQKSDSPRNSARHLSVDQDVILVYAVDASNWRPNRMPRSAAVDSKYKNPDGDPKGRWFGDNLRANKPYSLGLYEVTGPTGRTFKPRNGRYWRISQEAFNRLNAAGEIWWGSDGDAFPTRKRYLSEVGLAVPRTLWFNRDVGSNRTSASEIKKLFGDSEQGFPTPKPEALMERVLNIASDPGDLVLDFFAGSGTTAAVAHKRERRWITVQLQGRTVANYPKPRLQRVVEGSDKGGVTQSVSRVAGGDLPEGMTAEEAQSFNTQLTRVLKSVSDVDAPTIAALRSATRTRDEAVNTWSGGGGFTVAKIGPSMYEVDDEDGEVYLSPAATNGAWSRAVAGQLRFTRTPEHPAFCGVRGRQRLAVIDGVVDEGVVRSVVEHLGEKERAVIVGKSVLPEAVETLGELSPGSRIKKAPTDIFPKGTVK